MLHIARSIELGENILVKGREDMVGDAGEDREAEGPEYRTMSFE
jgi:hypothetical protein